MKYGRSTFSQLIDILLSDVGDVKLKKLTPSTWIDVILRAEEKICRLTTVRDEYTLRIGTGVTDYPLLTRPAITGASNATPIVLTIPSHGIPDNVRVYVTGAQGNDAANGAWFTSDGSANNLTLNPGAYVSGVEIVGTVATMTTETPHGFADGSTITLSGISTMIPDGDYVIALLSTTTFTITVPASTVKYPNGGVVYQKNVSTGDGVYTGGGRITRDNELPSYFGKFLSAHGVYRGFNFDTPGYQTDDLNATRSRYPYSWNPPAMAGIYVGGGRKYLRIDPPPNASVDVTITGEVQIIPVDCYGETETMQIHLPSEYDGMIIALMKARAYEKLGSVPMMQYWEDKKFPEMVKIHNGNEPSRRIRVDPT